MTKVKSGHVQAVGYDASTKTLAVDYGHGVYHYRNVPPHVHADLLKQKSVGSYLNKVVVGQYKFHRLDGPKRGKSKK